LAAAPNQAQAIPPRPSREGRARLQTVAISLSVPEIQARSQSRSRTSSRLLASKSWFPVIGILPPAHAQVLPGVERLVTYLIT